MGGHEARTYWEDRGLVLLWTSLLLGPASLAVLIGIGYAVVKWTCASGTAAIPISVTASALVMSGTGLWLGWSLLRQLRDAQEDGGRPADRSVFMATVALSINVLAVVLIVTAGITQLVVSPCE